jgi:hypothetical protein
MVLRPPPPPSAARSVARSDAVQMKARQAAKIRELKDALIAQGLVTLSSQSDALGLSRSTTWAILQANHKGSGLSGAIIKRMLLEPRLPAAARVKILEYVQEKAAGHYGHSKKRLRIFVAQFTRAEASQPSANSDPAPWHIGPDNESSGS